MENQMDKMEGQLSDKQMLQERYDTLQMEILNESDNAKQEALQEEANKIERELGLEESQTPDRMAA